MSTSHRLTPKQRLDLIALMQNDVYDRKQSLFKSLASNDNHRKSSYSNSVSVDEPNRKNANGSESFSTTNSNGSTNSYRRKKSASLNSTVNPGKPKSV